MKKFLTSLLAGVSLTLTPSLAQAGNTYEDHEGLWEALQGVGITTLINSDHCKSGSDGMYHTTAQLLIVCQDNGKPNGPQVEWTANDLDTLRHEAHHVIQDCNEGAMGDGDLGLLFSNEDDLIDFISKSSYSTEELKDLISFLEKDGLSPYHILLEVEAYIVAADIEASMIAGKVTEFCSD